MSALTAKFVADFESFHAAVTKAETELRGLETGANKVGTSLNKVADSFSGRKIIQDANLAAKAIADIGGAAFLTEAEQKRVNATVTEAIAKYQALGKEAPAALHALQAQTSQLVHSVEPLPAHLQKVQEKSTLAAKATSLFGSSIAQITSAFTLSSLIDRGVGALVSWTKSAIDSAGTMVDLSKKTGLSTETIQRMSFVAKQSGTDMDAFANSALKLGVNISKGTGAARQAAEDLGLSWQKLRAQSPDEQYAAVVAALERMENPQKRNTDAIALMGKVAAEVLPAIADGYTKMGAQATVAGDAQVRALDAASDAWDRWVSKQKTGIMQALGSWAIANETLGRLNKEQQAAYQALLRGGGDAQAFLLSLAAKTRHTEPDFPAVVAPKIPPSFIADLKAAEEGYKKLTSAQKLEIESALKLNQSNDDIINSLGITEGELAVAKKAYEDHNAALNKAKSIAEAHAEALRDVIAAQIPLTSAQKASIKTLSEMGVSSETIAKALNTSSIATKNYTDNLAFAAKMEKEMDDFQRERVKTIHELTKASEKRVEAEQAARANFGVDAQTAQLKALIDFQEKNTQAAMHGTQLRLHQIELERDATMRSFRVEYTGRSDLYDKAAKAANAFYDHEVRLALGTADTIVERMRAVGIVTRADLHTTAQNAIRDYEQMKASGLFTAEEIRKAFERMNKAMRADGKDTGIDWAARQQNLLADLKNIGKDTAHSIAADIGDGIRTSDWSQFENNLRDSLATGMGQAAAAAVNMVVPGLGTILEPIFEVLSDKLLGALGLGTKGRDIVKDFAASFLKAGDLSAGISGFDRLHEELNKLGAEGERLWINLTQGVGRNNPQEAARAIDAIRGALANITPTLGEQAAQAGFKTTAELKQIAEDARKLFEFMRDSGQYSAEAVQAAWERANEALIASGDKTAIAAKKAGDEIKKLDDQIKSLTDSIANEAPEEVMGVIEQQTRAQIAAIQAQRDAAQQALDDVAGDAADSAEAAAKAIQDTLDAHDFVARLRFDYELPEFGDSIRHLFGENLLGFASGTRGQYLNFGAGTPVMLHGREKISTLGDTSGGNEQPIYIQLDGHTLGRALLRHVSEAAQSYGLA